MASLGWGGSAFLGGLRTRSLPLRATVSGALLGGIIVSGLGVVLLGEDFPGLGAVAPAALGGLANLLALLTLFKALAIGSMSIVAPISATYPVVLVIYGLSQGERPAAIQLIGMGLVVAGVLLASYAAKPTEGDAVVAVTPDSVAVGASPPATQRSRRAGMISLVLAAVSALANGIALATVSSVAESSPYWGVVAMRGSALAAMFAFLIVAWRGVGAPAATLPGLLVIGTLDTIATGLFAVASTYGYLSVVSVIASLFPIGTIALARLTLGERILPHQNVGVAVALSGVALVALG